MDVALTIINDRDHRCRMQNLLGPLSRADPAPRFLLIGPPFLVRHGNPALARPDLAGNQPQTGMAIRIQRQHGMQLAMPRPTPLPISPRPRRRSAVVRKLISLVSWIASTCRPATLRAVCSPQPASKASNVTFSLARKRP
jgi:hypothetical protein